MLTAPALGSPPRSQCAIGLRSYGEEDLVTQGQEQPGPPAGEGGAATGGTSNGGGGMKRNKSSAAGLRLQEDESLRQVRGRPFDREPRPDRER